MEDASYVLNKDPVIKAWLPFFGFRTDGIGNVFQLTPLT